MSQNDPPPTYDKPPPYSAHPPPHPSTGTPTPPGYEPYVGPAAQISGRQVPSYGATALVIQPQDIIFTNLCPVCRIGFLVDEYTCLGLLLAILFFPLGIICCLILKNRRCSNCGAYLG